MWIHYQLSVDIFLNFKSIFRDWPHKYDFAGINFRELHWKCDFAANFRELQKNSRKFIPAKVYTLKVCCVHLNIPTHGLLYGPRTGFHLIPLAACLTWEYYFFIQLYVSRFFHSNLNIFFLSDKQWSKKSGLEIKKIYRAGCFHASEASDTSVGREALGASSFSWGSWGRCKPPSGVWGGAPKIWRFWYIYFV